MRPKSFGRYIFLERLGSGGMAEVFLARSQDALDRLVAIKCIHSHHANQDKFASMLIQEANIAARLSHPNVAQVYDLGQNDGQYYIVMEHVHGRDLRAIFRRYANSRQALPVALACHVGVKACEGLDYIHNRRDYSGRDLRLVHRDISLHNLILSFDGEVKIIDFGVAKSTSQSVMTDPGFIKGKLPYMSPEQLNRGPVDRRSDVFSLGVVLFELLTGQRLFWDKNVTAVVKKLRKVAVPRPSSINPAIPHELEAIVLKALAKRPKDRFQSAGEMQEALLAFVHRRGHQLTTRQVSGWIQSLYAEEYEAEAAHIAWLWSDTDSLVPSARVFAEGSGRHEPLSSGAPVFTPHECTQVGWAPPPRVRILGDEDPTASMRRRFW